MQKKRYLYIFLIKCFSKNKGVWVLSYQEKMVLDLEKCFPDNPLLKDAPKVSWGYAVFIAKVEGLYFISKLNIRL